MRDITPRPHKKGASPKACPVKVLPDRAKSGRVGGRYLFVLRAGCSNGLDADATDSLFYLTTVAARLAIRAC